VIELKVYKRKELGNKVNRLRKRDIVPGVVYGYKIESLPIAFGVKDFERVYKEAGETTLVTLKIAEDEKGAGTGEETVLIHDISLDPLSGNFRHVDFKKVQLDQKIRVSLPIVFEGESPAVEVEGGTLVKNMYDVEVEGFPHKLPKEVVLDISKLKTFDDNFTVGDIMISEEEVEVVGEKDSVIALVQPPRTQEELEALEEAPEEDVADVEVEGGEDTEEEEAESKTETETEGTEPAKEKSKEGEENKKEAKE